MSDWPKLTCLAQKTCYFTLRKHAYSNILKILPPKNENFQIKKSDIIFIFLLKTFIYFILFKQCLKRMTQLAINNYSTLWSSN